MSGVEVFLLVIAIYSTVGAVSSLILAGLGKSYEVSPAASAVRVMIGATLAAFAFILLYA